MAPSVVGYCVTCVPLHLLRFRNPAVEPDRRIAVRRKEHELNIREPLLVRAVEFEDAHEGRADLRRRRNLAPGGNQRDAAGQLRAIGGKTADDAVAVSMSHQVSRTAAQMLDDLRRVVREVMQRQPVHCGGTAVNTPRAHSDGPVACGLDVMHQSVEIADAAPQGRYENHHIPAAPHFDCNLAAIHLYLHDVLLESAC